MNTWIKDQNAIWKKLEQLYQEIYMSCSLGRNRKLHLYWGIYRRVEYINSTYFVFPTHWNKELYISRFLLPILNYICIYSIYSLYLVYVLHWYVDFFVFVLYMQHVHRFPNFYDTNLFSIRAYDTSLWYFKGIIKDLGPIVKQIHIGGGV